MQFSTKDNDNDSNSGSWAHKYKGDWLHRNRNLNLNGLYHGGPQDSYADGIDWLSFRGYYYSLRHSEMKLKPVSQNWLM